jgi:hypothetical protein
MAPRAVSLYILTSLYDHSSLLTLSSLSLEVSSRPTLSLEVSSRPTLSLEVSSRPTLSLSLLSVSLFISVSQLFLLYCPFLCLLSHYYHIIYFPRYTKHKELKSVGTFL